MAGAEIGQVCYGDAQCQLEDRSSFCHFVLRGVFGHCKCLYGEDEHGGCKDKFEGNF